MTTEEYVAILSSARYRTNAEKDALAQLADLQPMGRNARQLLYTAQDRLAQAVDCLDEVLWLFEAVHRLAFDVPAACTGTEWLPSGMCDDGGPGGRCPVHSEPVTDLT